MLLQALLSVAIIAVLAGALLTSALVDTKVAAHQLAVRATNAALARGTAEFVNWAQRYVAMHGAAATWPTAATTDAPIPACASDPCPLMVKVLYQVVGSTADSTSGPDPASNLEEAVAENRISGTVTVTLMNNLGTIVASQTRYATLRVFDSAPFALMTGSRDVTTLAGPDASREGDTGGYRAANNAAPQATPNPINPSAAKDTIILVSMTCNNSFANSNQQNPFLDDHAPGDDFKPWGVSGGTAFEAPCSPEYGFSSMPTAPPDAPIPENNIYDISSYGSIVWQAATNRPNEWAP